MISISSAKAADAIRIESGDVYESVPPQEICLDSPDIFYTRDYEFYSTTDTITDERNFWQASTLSSTGEPVKQYAEKAIVYSGTSSTEPAPISGEFSLTWRDCGIDADGDRIDVKLVYSNIMLRHKIMFPERPLYTCQPTDTFTLVLLDDKGRFGGTHNWAPHNTNLAYDIAFFATKTKNGQTASGIFYSGIQGLTEPDDFLAASGDLARFNSDYSEHVELVDKYVPVVYKPPESEIRLANENKSFLPPYPRSKDVSGYHCGVVIGLYPDGGKIRWGSTNTGGGNLFVPFESRTIETSAGEGGSIAATTGYTSPDGNVFVGWKNSRSITATADQYYRISRITVDNTVAYVPDYSTNNGKTYSYLFENVRDNHSINAEFERIKVNISYDANAPVEAIDGTMPTDTVDAGTSNAVRSNGFTYVDGRHRFLGWNTRPDGTGDTYDSGSLDDEMNKIFVEEEDVVLMPNGKT